MKDPYSVIRSPQLSEKSQRLQKANTYVFVVDKAATKGDVKAAVEKIYGTEVESVRTAVMKGKAARARNQVTAGRRKDWKKAFVTLKEGKRLDII